MKCVYETANALDAHVVADILSQQEIEARIDGEFLQGGVGDLQALNYIRVMVKDTEVEQALKIIEEWESAQPDTRETIQSSPKKPGQLPGFVAGLMFGALITVGVLYIMFKTPHTSEGIDYDGDGVYEEEYFYDGYLLTETKIDRNRDRRFDDITYFTLKGTLDYSEFDDNFDGFFETTVTYRDGLVVEEVSDYDKNGKYDQKAFYRDGVLSEIHFFGKDLFYPVKIQKIAKGRVVYAEYDEDRDGVMDTAYEFDEYEEVSKKYDL